MGSSVLVLCVWYVWCVLIHHLSIIIVVVILYSLCLIRLTNVFTYFIAHSILHCRLPFWDPYLLLGVLFLIVVLQLSPFFPYSSPLLATPHLPHSIYPMLSLSTGPLYNFLDLLCPLLSSVNPAPVLSGYCQFVLYFHVSGSVLLSCLFCWLGSTYRWNHTVFVFHCLAYFT